MNTNRITDILDRYGQGEQDSFKFIAFWSPPITDEHYSWVKECGYTHLIIDRKYDAEYGSAKMGEAVHLAGKYGLKAILSTGDFLTAEHPYADEPSFDGAYEDEPLSIGDLEKHSKGLYEFQKKYPGKCFYVNLVRLNGRSWDVYSEYFKKLFLIEADRKTVSGDIYPLREPDASGNTMVPFLDYIRRIGKLAAETDSEMYFFVQTIAMHGNGWGHPARRPTWEDIRFLQYVILSCGARGFQHFCYMSPGLPPYTGEFREEDYACVHPKGYRTEIWYAAQKVIAEFKQFENIFLKFSWKGIMPVYGSTGEQCENFDELGEYVKGHSYVKDVKAEKALLIGCFEDADGNVGFSLVNFTDPYAGQNNQISITFRCMEEIAVIKNGQVRTQQLEDGVYSVTLDPGEGQFVILPKQDEAMLSVITKKEEKPSYLSAPEGCLWKEDFSIGNQLDTYNVYGSGNSHFEFLEKGYPEGGCGRVVRLYTSTGKEKDWSTYKISLPDIPYDANQKLVFKMYFTESAFTMSVSYDHMKKMCRSVECNTLERYGRWTWLDVPLKEIRQDGLSTLSEVTICIGAGIPFGTVAYMDEILLCDM